MNKLNIQFLIWALVASFQTYASTALKSQGKGVWQFAIEGIYADQTNNLPTLYGGNPLGNTSSASSSSNNPYATLSDHVFKDPDTTWGVGANLGYIFPSHLYDIQLTYLGIFSNTTSNERVAIPPMASGEPFGIEVDEEFNIDSADIMFGRYFTLHENLLLRASFGLLFAFIEQTNHSVFSELDAEGTGANNHFKNEFTGGGPKLQLDGAFYITQPLAIVANFGVATLLGEAKIENKLVQTGVNTTFNDDFHDSDYRVAFEADSKLGLLFSQAFSHHLAFNLEAGFTIAAYLNALRDDDIQQFTDKEGLLYQTDGDYSYWGPYLTLGMSFM